MARRLRTLGIVLAVIGLGFLVGGGVAYAKVQDGYDSLQAFSEQQNVQLNYDENGQLTDRGTTEGAEAIMALLVRAGRPEPADLLPVRRPRASAGRESG